jgi:hypothetical protein
VRSWRCSLAAGCAVPSARRSAATAYDEAVKLGIAPCPEMQCLASPVGKKHLRKVQLDLVNRLLTEEELRRRLPMKGYNE